MSKKPNPEMIDAENPEWTAEAMRGAIPFEDMPESFQAMVKRGRGAQKAPTKQQVTLRLSPEVITGFKEAGKGWQGRIDQALREWLVARQR